MWAAVFSILLCWPQKFAFDYSWSLKNWPNPVNTEQNTTLVLTISLLFLISSGSMGLVSSESRVRYTDRYNTASDAQLLSWTTYKNKTGIRPPTDHLSINHLPTTYRPSTDHLPTIYQPPTNHLPTTYRPTNHLPTTYQPTTHQPPTDHLPTTYRPPTDHLPTIYQPPTDRFFTVQLVQYYWSTPKQC